MKITSLAFCAVLALPAVAQEVPTTMPLVHRSGSLLVPGLPSMTALPLASAGSAPAMSTESVVVGTPLDDRRARVKRPLHLLVVGERFWWPDDLVDEGLRSEAEPLAPIAGETYDHDRLHLEREIARLERILTASRRELDRLQLRIDRMLESADHGVSTYEGGDTLPSLGRRRDELAVVHEANLRRYEHLVRELRLLSP